MNYTYKLNGVAVNPSGKWEIEFRRNEGQIFWRRYLTGELMFKGEDYNFIIGQVEELVSVSGCVELDLVIYCEDVEFWTGKFKYPYSFKFDEDNCTLTGTPEVVDEYTCIMENYNTEYEVYPAIGGTTLNLYDCGGVPIRVLTVGFPLVNTFPNTSYLYDLIWVKMKCRDFDLVSSFMLRDEFPGYAPGHYASIYGTNNYVTGATNRLEYIFLMTNTALKSALSGGTLTCPGPYANGLFKFKDFEDFLRNTFNAYWYFDSDGNFRIEHISYFLSDFPYSDFDSHIDLTEILSGCHNFAERKNKYTHQSDKLFDQERWKWQHYYGTEGTITHGADFQGLPVFYGITEGDKSDCVPGEFKEKEIISSYFWSDIYWAYQLIAAGEIDTIGCPGFCFVDVHDPTGSAYIRCETGQLSAIAPPIGVINGHCSTANLQAHYHTWDRIFLTGTMNNGSINEINNFDSAIKKKLQDEIEFPLCCDTEFDPMKQVTTEMGDGAVYSAVQTKYSVKIQLLYD